ncbi:hypothetical protein ES708_15473 [subsurface metagenome]
MLDRKKQISACLSVGEIQHYSPDKGREHPRLKSPVIKLENVCPEQNDVALVFFGDLAYAAQGSVTPLFHNEAMPLRDRTARLPDHIGALPLSHIGALPLSHIGALPLSHIGALPLSGKGFGETCEMKCFPDNRYFITMLLNILSYIETFDLIML